MLPRWLLGPVHAVLMLSLIACGGGGSGGNAGGNGGDGGGVVSKAIPSINAPTLAGGRFHAVVGTPLRVRAAAHDVDGDALILRVVSNGIIGEASVDDHGYVIYTAHSAGVERLLIGVSDGIFPEVTAAFEYIVAPHTGANHPPIATGYTAHVVAGVPVYLQLPAADPDGDTLSFRIERSGPGQHQFPATGKLEARLTAGGPWVEVAARSANQGPGPVIYGSQVRYTAAIGEDNEQIHFIANDGQADSGYAIIHLRQQSGRTGSVRIEAEDVHGVTRQPFHVPHVISNGGSHPFVEWFIVSGPHGMGPIATPVPYDSHRGMYLPLAGEYRMRAVVRTGGRRNHTGTTYAQTDFTVTVAGPGYTMHGTIEDDDQPSAGSAIHLQFERLAPGFDGVVLTTHSDEDGYWSIAGLVLDPLEYEALVAERHLP